ncbi:MAG: hypothetical protein NVS1B10_06490 [Candidatus Saccharimonadales bacterium]
MQAIATSSGVLAVSTGAQVTSLECTLSSVQVTPAAADAVLTVYDGTSTAGLVLANLTVKASTATLVYPVNVPCYANKGIYYTLTGAAATAIIHFVPA